MEMGSPQKLPPKSPHKPEYVDEIHYKECRNLCYSLLGKFQQIIDESPTIIEAEGDILQNINEII